VLVVMMVEGSEEEGRAGGGSLSVFDTHLRK
jgi:hypothetical protein